MRGAIPFRRLAGILLKLVERSADGESIRIVVPVTIWVKVAPASIRASPGLSGRAILKNYCIASNQGLRCPTAHSCLLEVVKTALCNRHEAPGKPIFVDGTRVSQGNSLWGGSDMRTWA